jgi:hypothetical protein
MSAAPRSAGLVEFTSGGGGGIWLVASFQHRTISDAEILGAASCGPLLRLDMTEQSVE